jgi:hypothetical protein
MIRVSTDHPNLRVGCHSWYQSITGVIHHVRAIFSKTYGEETLRCPYKDYSSLNRWQANWNLLSTIYFPVMTHLRQGKKACILPSGDVNPGPVPSRRGLIEDISYRAVGATCLLCDWPQPHT